MTDKANDITERDGKRYDCNGTEIHPYLVTAEGPNGEYEEYSYVPPGERHKLPDDWLTGTYDNFVTVEPIKMVDVKTLIEGMIGRAPDIAVNVMWANAMCYALDHQFAEGKADV